MRLLPRLLSLLLAPLAAGAQPAYTLYSTAFEKNEGYNSKYDLAGQNGWTKYGANMGGNGLVTNFLGSQAAFVGLFPLSPRAEFLNVWQPVNFSPVPGSGAVVKFSVLMAIIDSTNRRYDSFYWSVYNSQADRLFTLDFDNYDFGIYYALDGTNGFQDSGAAFETNLAYQLEITMDLENNHWGATLEGATVVSNQPITTTGALLDIGDIDAVWAVNATNAPGDNFMVFDDYEVWVEYPSATVQLLGTPPGPFAVRLSGASGLSYAIEASPDLTQWTPLKTNVITDGYFDYLDTTGTGASRRFYRGRWVP